MAKEQVNKVDYEQINLNPHNLIHAAHAVAKYMAAAEQLKKISAVIFNNADESTLDHLDPIAQEFASESGMSTTLDVLKCLEVLQLRAALHATMELPDTMAHVMAPVVNTVFYGDELVNDERLEAPAGNLFWQVKLIATVVQEQSIKGPPKVDNPTDEG